MHSFFLSLIKFWAVYFLFGQKEPLFRQKREFAAMIHDRAWEHFKEAKRNCSGLA
jgi:hypothetical protein